MESLFLPVRPDAAGNFEMRTVPACDYPIAAVDSVQAGATDDPEYLKELQERATKISVADGTPLPAITLTLR